MTKKFTHLLKQLLLPSFLLLGLTGQSQSFSTCSGQTILSISGETTSTIQNLTGNNVTIRVTARGGDGGNTGLGGTGGGGATMIGEFELAPNETIRAISGGTGGNGANQFQSGGGGGGSGVVNCHNPSDCSTGTILIIAAGGNGSSTSGGTGVGGSTATGSGNGGSSNNNSGGGGGVNSSGTSNQPTGGGGIVLKTGLSTAGTGIQVSGAQGMGGGGTSVSASSGGGGGQTGGVSTTSSASSLNIGSNQNNTNGVFNGGTNTVGSIICECLAILPVELIEFKAIPIQKQTLITWQTASEINNQGFEIEHSTDGNNWRNIGFVNGNGTSYELTNYQFLHQSPVSGINYYRLKQIDFDGNYEYSKTVPVNVEKGGNIVVYPNPSTGQFNISGIDIQNASVSIYNTVGQLVKEEILTQSVLDVSDLVDGLYYLTIKQGNMVHEVKVVKK